MAALAEAVLARGPAAVVRPPRARRVGSAERGRAAVSPRDGAAQVDPPAQADAARRPDRAAPAGRRRCPGGPGPRPPPGAGGRCRPECAARFRTAGRQRQCRAASRRCRRASSPTAPKPTPRPAPVRAARRLALPPDRCSRRIRARARRPPEAAPAPPPRRARRASRARRRRRRRRPPALQDAFLEEVRRSEGRLLHARWPSQAQRIDVESDRIVFVFAPSQARGEGRRREETRVARAAGRARGRAQDARRGCVADAGWPGDRSPGDGGGLRGRAGDAAGRRAEGQGAERPGHADAARADAARHQERGTAEGSGLTARDLRRDRRLENPTSQRRRQLLGEVPDYAQRSNRLLIVRADTL